MLAAAMAAGSLAGCVATQSDVRSLQGRLNYLEQRVEGTEDLAAEISGSAREQVLASRQEMSEKLETVRKQSAQLTARIQSLEVQLQGMRGELTELQSAVAPMDRRLQALDERLAAVEGAARGLGDGSGRSEAPDPSAFQWGSEGEGYEAARHSFEEGSLTRARQQFHELLRRWPKGTYAPNAHFWLGEIYFKNEDYINAIDKYLHVVEAYGDHQKAPAAYYKMGLALIELGETAKARRALEDLISLYPQADQAAAAKDTLASIEP